MQQILKQIARENEVSVEEVRKEIAAAIREGMHCPDPAVRQAWDAIPRKQETPTPEEVIAYLAAQIVAEQIAGSAAKPFVLAAK